MLRRRRREFKKEQTKIDQLRTHIAMLQDHSAMVVDSSTRDIPEVLQPLLKSKDKSSIETELQKQRPYLPFKMREPVEPPPKRLFPLRMKSYTTASGATGVTSTDTCVLSQTSSKPASVQDIFAIPQQDAVAALDVEHVSLEVEVRESPRIVDSADPLAGLITLLRFGITGS